MTTKPDACEATLQKLVAAVDPGQVTIYRPAYAKLLGREGIAVLLQTRSEGMAFVAKTIRLAAENALDWLDEEPGPDPIIPTWGRTTRHQRQAVIQKLRASAARHMAAAARAQIAKDPIAAAEYELADAFTAAVQELDLIETDDEDRPLEREPLKVPSKAPRPITELERARARRALRRMDIEPRKK